MLYLANNDRIKPCFILSKIRIPELQLDSKRRRNMTLPVVAPAGEWVVERGQSHVVDTDRRRATS